MVDGENAPLEPRESIESVGHGAGLMSSHNQSPVAGLWRPTAAVWDRVRQGDLLGAVYVLYGDPAHEMRAQRDGVVISVPKNQYLDAVRTAASYYRKRANLSAQWVQRIFST